MRNVISSAVLLMLFVAIVPCRSQQIMAKRFNQSFALQHTVSASDPLFHVFTSYEQMNLFFKPAIINETNASPVIAEKDFINQFVVAVSGSRSGKTKPVIISVLPKNNTLYVYYEEVKSAEENKTAVMAVAKDNFKEIVFVNRSSGNQKRIYYRDVSPAIAKIVVSYLDMPASEAYKHEYQISIDETGEVIAVKDENGEITNQIRFAVSDKVFDQLKTSAANLDNAGERIDRNTPKGKKYKEILLLNDANQVLYSLTWDSERHVSESTQRFVQTIENLVPEKAISFTKHSEREVARN